MISSFQSFRKLKNQLPKIEVSFLHLYQILYIYPHIVFNKSFIYTHFEFFTIYPSYYNIIVGWVECNVIEQKICLIYIYIYIYIIK